MKIKYKNTIVDFERQAGYYATHAPEQKKKIQYGRWGLSIVTLLIVVFRGIRHSNEMIAYGIFPIALFLIIFYTYPELVKDREMKRVRKQYKIFGADAEGFWGEHELELTDTVLIDRTAGNEQKQQLNSVYAVVRDGVRSYIYLNPQQSLILPQKRIVEGNYEEFVRQLESVIGRHGLS